METHTLILGLGNPLMADDGAGIRVIELLRRDTLPAGVKVQEGGTAGMGLVPEMEGYRRMILVDCALIDARPGEWRRFSLEEANLLGGSEDALSLHNADLSDALRLANALDLLPPEVVVFGIQPACVEWNQPMSDQVKSALPQVTRAILTEVSITNSNRQLSA